MRDFQSADEFFGGAGAVVVHAGEVLTFEFESWSRYDGVTFYLFRDTFDKVCVWGLRDDDDVQEWRSLFWEDYPSKPADC
jgi:hypothetical protein